MIIIHKQPSEIYCMLFDDGEFKADEEGVSAVDIISNPEYENAQYELRFDGLNDPYPHRFNVEPPSDLFEHGKETDYAWEWVKKHSIPPKFYAREQNKD